MSKPLKVGNAQGFWGDSVDAPVRLITQQPDLDYLTLDYLAEVSMSILAKQRERDPTSGYAHDFLDVVRSLTPFWRNGRKLRLISNAGGLNPKGCAHACIAILYQAGCKNIKIGVVSGDDVLPVIKKLCCEEKNTEQFKNLETSESINKVLGSLVTANAYLGAHSIVEALAADADIIITGRVADPSLTVAPCIHHFGWSMNDCDRIAGATIAGHLIECGTQVTGGISTNWLKLKEAVDIGFPIAEISTDGSCVITKPKGTGGCVNEQTVKEQLVYEIGDPAHYLSPDATVSFLALKVQNEGEDRVCVSGAKGASPPSTYKVSATYRDGFRAQGMLTIFGRDPVTKARRCGEIILKRLHNAGYEFKKNWIECLGSGDVVPGTLAQTVKSDLLETVLRIGVLDPQREAVERFTKELAPLITSGPQGITGYAAGRPQVHEVFGYWPCLIENNLIKPKIEIFDCKT